jgi:hypothetical protein
MGGWRSSTVRRGGGEENLLGVSPQIDWLMNPGNPAVCVPPTVIFLQRATLLQIFEATAGKPVVHWRIDLILSCLKSWCIQGIVVGSA